MTQHSNAMVTIAQHNNKSYQWVHWDSDWCFKWFWVHNSTMSVQICKERTMCPFMSFFMANRTFVSTSSCGCREGPWSTTMWWSFQPACEACNPWPPFRIQSRWITDFSFKLGVSSQVPVPREWVIPTRSHCDVALTSILASHPAPHRVLPECEHLQ